MQWLPVESLRQLHFVAAFMHRADTQRANGDGITPSDVLTFRVSASRWLSSLHLRCCALLEARHCKLAAAAADELAAQASTAACRRSQGAAAAMHGAVSAISGDTTAAIQSYKAAQSALAQASDAGMASVDVLVALGDLHGATGGRAQARKAWELAADVLMHDVHAKGLREEQAAAELVNVYATGREVVVRVLLKAAWGAAMCDELSVAVGRLKEASNVLPLCRAGPVIYSQVALMHGQLQWRLSGAVLQTERSSAFALFRRALTVACAEIPCMYAAARNSLLQSAMLALHALHGGATCIAALAPTAAAAVEAALRKARDLTCMRVLLESCSSEIGLPELSSLPQWLLVRLKAGDAHHMVESARTAPAAEDTELKQAALRALCALCDVPPGVGLAYGTACEQQSIAVHASVRAMLPQYEEVCCVKDATEASDAIRRLYEVTAAVPDNREHQEDPPLPSAGAGAGSTDSANAVHVQWVVDEIPGHTAGAQSAGVYGTCNFQKSKLSVDRRAKKQGAAVSRGAGEAGTGASKAASRNWMLIAVRAAGDRERQEGDGGTSVSSVIGGAVPVESARLQSVLQQVHAPSAMCCMQDQLGKSIVCRLHVLQVHDVLATNASVAGVVANVSHVHR